METFSGLRASQHPDELAQLIAFIRASNITRYLEVGARHGDTFHAIASSLPAGSRAVAVDMPGGAWGRPGSEFYLGKAARDLRTNHDIDCHVILGNSHAGDVIEQAARLGPYGLVFIDADHRYVSVKADWDAYRGMGAVIGFHDVEGEGQGAPVRGGKAMVEVPRLWAELQGQYRTQVFSSNAKMGIGLVFQDQPTGGGQCPTKRGSGGATTSAPGMRS